PGLDAGRRGARARRRGQSARSQARVAARDQTGAQRGGEEGKQVMRRAVALVAVGLSITGAATPRPLEPPPPDLARVIPFAAAPSEKPHLTIELPIPPAPVELPAFPPTSPMAPVADKPTAFISSPRALPCVGSWLGVARVRSRALPARRLRGCGQGPRQRRAQGHRARAGAGGAVLASRDAVAPRPHRAGRLAVPAGRAGGARAGPGDLGTARQRLDGAAPARDGACT